MNNLDLIPNCYHCTMGLAIHHHPETSTWMVPSRRSAYRMYSVQIYRMRPLAFSCSCRWGASNNTTGPCFHVLAAITQIHEVRYTMPAVAVELAASLRLVQLALQEQQLFPEDTARADHDSLTVLAGATNYRLNDLARYMKEHPLPEDLARHVTGLTPAPAAGAAPTPAPTRSHAEPPAEILLGAA